MAWDDVGNMWWMKRQDQSESMLPALALGMQKVQQDQQMRLRTKEFALQQQLRTDALEFKNREMDLKMNEYSDVKSDMLTMADVQSGKIKNPTFKRPEGWKAYELLQSTQSLMEYRQARQLQESKNAAEYEKMLVKVLGSPSFRNEGQAVSFGQKKFGWTPELMATVDELYNQGLDAGEIKEDVRTVGGVKGVIRNGNFFPLTQGLQHPENILNRAQQAEIDTIKSRIIAIQNHSSQMMEEQGTPEYDATEKRIQALQERINQIQSGSASDTSKGTSKVSTKAEFDALPSGATYINAKDGKTYRKP
jgi:hypothetical protein